MTHLSAQASSPGIPGVTPVADIIDSLKRLERVGSENSKATEKLIGAARDLEALILEQFPRLGDDAVIVSRERDGYSHSPTDTGFHDFLRETLFEYRISDNRLVDLGIQQSPAESRKAALRFSEAVANGLLEEVIAKAETMKSEVDQAALKLVEGIQAFREATCKHPMHRPALVDGKIVGVQCGTCGVHLK
jgi:hypothetical protein